MGSGRGTGPRGTPPATSASHRTHRALDARANNTVSRRRRRRPPPAPSSFATLHNRTRRPAPEAGGNRWTLPPNPPSFPPGAIPRQSTSSHLRFSLSSSALSAQVQLWWETQPPSTHPSVGMNISLPPPFPEAYMVLPNPQFGGGGRREQCLAGE